MFGGGLEPRAWRARESEPITGVWGGVQGQSPWSGERSPPEAENLLASRCATEAENLPHSPQFANFLSLTTVTKETQSNTAVAAEAI